MRKIEIISKSQGHVYWSGDSFNEMIIELDNAPCIDDTAVRFHVDGFVTDVWWGFFRHSDNYIG